MNEQLQHFARQELKDGLGKLPEKCHMLFKRMYSPDDLEKPINDVVDIMPDDRLNHAMQQVSRSIEIETK